jgi:hypothetical protein
VAVLAEQQGVIVVICTVAGTGRYWERFWLRTPELSIPSQQSLLLLSLMLLQQQRLMQSAIPAQQQQHSIGIIITDSKMPNISFATFLHSDSFA